MQEFVVNKCCDCWLYADEHGAIIEHTHHSVVVMVVGVCSVVDADGDGEWTAGAHPAAVESAGGVEAPRDGADDEHEGAAGADQGPRVGTAVFTTSDQ